MKDFIHNELKVGDIVVRARVIGRSADLSFSMILKINADKASTCIGTRSYNNTHRLNNRTGPIHGDTVLKVDRSVVPSDLLVQFDNYLIAKGIK